MRTTIDIPDALYRELRSKATREKRSLKELIPRGIESELRAQPKKPELIRRALAAPRRRRFLNGLRVFDLSTESPKVSSRKVRALEAAFPKRRS